jgi:hypothetical protein
MYYNLLTRSLEIGKMNVIPQRDVPAILASMTSIVVYSEGEGEGERKGT